MFRLSVKKAYYDKNIVIEDFELLAEKGENIFISGRSGIGKSTILKIIGGIHKQFDGSITFEAEDVRIAYVPQTVGLLPWKNVFKNIVILKKSESRLIDNNKATHLIETLGLTGLEKRYPHQISGGQRSRVALGQALFYEPDVLLLDEPYSALDYDTKLTALKLTQNVLSGKNITTVLVSHDPNEAEYLECRVIKL